MTAVTYYKIGNKGKREVVRENEKPLDLVNRFNKKQEIHSSYFLFPQSLLTYSQEKNGTKGYIPEWLIARNFIIDIDCKGDLEKALNDTRKIYEYFSLNYEVTPSVWFSGMKGFHLYFDEKIFGNFEKHKELNSIHLFIAKRVAAELKLSTIDEQIYTKTGSIRDKWSFHEKSGLCKIPIDLTWTLQQIIAKAGAPTFEEPVMQRTACEKLVRAKTKAYATYKNYFDGVKSYTAKKSLHKVPPGERHARVVKEAGMLCSNNIFFNKAVEIIDALSEAKFDPPLPFDEIKSQVADVYERYSSKEIENEFTTMASAIEKTREYLKTPHSYMKTGWTDFDKSVEIERGFLIIIGAKSGVGKSTFALNLQEKIIFHDNKEHGFFSLEMPTEKIVPSLMSIHFKKDRKEIENILRGDGLKENSQFISFMEKKSNIRIFTTYEPLTIEKLDKSIKSLKQHLINLHSITIDYFGCLSVGGYGNKAEELPQELKRLCLKHNILIIVLTQVRKQKPGSGRTIDKYTEITVEDLKDSSEIINAADIIFTGYRKKYSETKETIIIEDAKDRYNPEGEGKKWEFSYINNSIGLDCKTYDQQYFYNAKQEITYGRGTEQDTRLSSLV
jgi:replicative DNA helicase